MISALEIDFLFFKQENNFFVEALIPGWGLENKASSFEKESRLAFDKGDPAFTFWEVEDLSNGKSNL